MKKKIQKPLAQLYANGFIVSLPTPYLYIKGNARMIIPIPLHHYSPYTDSCRYHPYHPQKQDRPPRMLSYSFSLSSLEE